MTEPTLAPEAPSKSEGQTTATDSTDSSSTETTAEQTQQTEQTAETTTEPDKGELEAYEVQNPSDLPDGIEFHSTIRDTFTEVARELELSQEGAQGLFDKTMVALHKRAIEEQDRQSKEWIAESKKDPDYGGDKFDENSGKAEKAIAEFGSDDLRALLKESTVLGNHPEMFRFMVRVGKALSEDGFVGGNKATAIDPSDDEARAKRMFPNSAP